MCNNQIDSILKTGIFCNSSITFKNKPFLQSNLRTINDIWDSNNINFKSCHDIYNLLIDRRNCISEFSKMKKIPEKFIKVLKGETTIVPESRVTLDINDKLQFLKTVRGHV